jgi:DNA 3'-phosphatase
MKELQKVLFTDLDGTLIETKSGRTFPIHSDDWKFISETLTAIKDYYDRGYKIVIVTNQGGIESGFITEAIFINKIETICKRLESILKLQKNSVSYYYCPTMKGYNRKPNSGMVITAMEDYELTLRSSVMLGDMESDRDLSINSGITFYFSIEDIKQMYNASGL